MFVGIKAITKLDQEQGSGGVMPGKVA